MWIGFLWLWMGQKGDGIPGITSPVFSPDGKRFAYAAYRENKWVVVVDGVESKEYDTIRAGPLFSPDGRMTFTAARGDKRLAVLGVESKEFVVVDGIESKEYDAIRAGSLSSTDGRMTFAAARGDKMFMVLDDVEHDAIRVGPLSSPPDLWVAYAAEKILILDGAAEEYAQKYGRRSLVLSPDGKRLAYIDKRGGKELTVVNSAKGKEYNGIADGGIAFPPVFSPDGKRFAYAAYRENKWVVVVDGIETKAYDELISSHLVFDGPNQVRFLATRGGEILRAEVTIK